MAKTIKWVAAFDTHGDMIDREAEKVFFNFVAGFKPDLRIHGGDVFDMRTLRANVNESERTESLKEDVEAGIAFLRRFEAKVLMMGNHDHRLIRAIRNRGSGNTRLLASMLWDSVLDRLPDLKIMPYTVRGGIFTLGNLSILHGFHMGKYAPQESAALCVSSALMGHIHTEMSLTAANCKTHVGYSSGCLCRLDMEYAETWARNLRWSHGFAFGYSRGGETSVYFVNKRNGQWNDKQMKGVANAVYDGGKGTQTSN